MAVTSFKQQLWENAIIESYKGISVAEIITKKPTRVDGSKAIFNTASLTNGLQDYTGKVNWEQVNTTPIELNFDQSKYFAFYVDDVDAVQLAGDVMLPMVNEQTAYIKDTIDSAVFVEAVKGAKASNVIGSVATKKPVTTSEDAYNYIVDLGTQLDNNKAPYMGRFVIARPEFVNLLAKDKRVVDNTIILPTGVVQGMEVNGMQVIKTMNCPANQVIALHTSAVGYGKQIDKMKAVDLQDAFGEGIKGLVQYGVKTLQGEGIAVLNYSL
ncbi:hypothetical protein [Clostridium beijerinckii]|uniref:Uncharacterized protein n=1 Tax=Clostridium beijerinckii TaxID=1520 RepID=A0AAE5H061_CLOBE|nr:hypothetical protein [Clostridium beijerinckii]NSB12120.1 hypothetical protein [Clostridium beijerinckii]OOM27453.1 hypothetical protein CLOBE_30110 [Clostridium beijerinckii]